MTTEEIRNKLIDKGLIVTPQRIAILDAVNVLRNHPTADNIIEFVRQNHPNIAPGTVYKVLDAFLSCGLIHRVRTEKDIMRYDPLVDSHHHLYSSDSDRIEDFHDEELNSLLKKYFEKKKIPNFKIEELKLQIIGKFKDGSS